MPLTAEEKIVRQKAYSLKSDQRKKEKEREAAETKRKVEERKRKAHERYLAGRLRRKAMEPFLKNRTPGDQPTPMATPVRSHILSCPTFVLSPQQNWQMQKYEEQQMKASENRKHAEDEQKRLQERHAAEFKEESNRLLDVVDSIASATTTQDPSITQEAAPRAAKRRFVKASRLPRNMEVESPDDRNMEVESRDDPGEDPERAQKRGRY